MKNKPQSNSAIHYFLFFGTEIALLEQTSDKNSAGVSNACLKSFIPLWGHMHSSVDWGRIAP